MQFCGNKLSRLTSLTYWLIPAPVSQSVECLLWGRGGHGFDRGLWNIKVVKNGNSCSSLGSLTLHWSSTIKVSLELPATTRHRCDMTEKLLKSTLIRTNRPLVNTYSILWNLFSQMFFPSTLKLICFQYASDLCIFDSWNICWLWTNGNHNKIYYL